MGVTSAVKASVQELATTIGIGAALETVGLGSVAGIRNLKALGFLLRAFSLSMKGRAGVGLVCLSLHVLML